MLVGNYYTDCLQLKLHVSKCKKCNKFAYAHRAYINDIELTHNILTIDQDEYKCIVTLKYSKFKTISIMSTVN